MSDALLSPERRVMIAGKEYALDGTFVTLKAIQQGFDCEILKFLGTRVAFLPFDDIARVIRLAIPEDAPPLEAIEREIVEEIGIEDARQLVGEWLLLSVTPRRDREKKLADLNRAMKRPASRGGNTASSA